MKYPFRGLSFAGVFCVINILAFVVVLGCTSSCTSTGTPAQATAGNQAYAEAVLSQDAYFVIANSAPAREQARAAVATGSLDVGHLPGPAWTAFLQRGESVSLYFKLNPPTTVYNALVEALHRWDSPRRADSTWVTP